MDLVRQILLDIEKGTLLFDADFLSATNDYTADNVRDLRRHLILMGDHRLIDIQAVEYSSVRVHGLTWEGHDFLDTVRDPEIWRKTKGAASTVGGVGFKALMEIGKALAKQELQKLGIPIP